MRMSGHLDLCMPSKFLTAVEFWHRPRKREPICKVNLSQQRSTAVGLNCPMKIRCICKFTGRGIFFSQGDLRHFYRSTMWILCQMFSVQDLEDILPSCHTHLTVVRGRLQTLRDCISILWINNLALRSILNGHSACPNKPPFLKERSRKEHKKSIRKLSPSQYGLRHPILR